MDLRFSKRLFKIFLFFPILIYLGERSYLAYDEGFYALQARWIIENNNWIIPSWWDYLALDRTIGIQYLIAKSQFIFGMSSFNAHLPTTLASGLMLLITYKLHQELLGKKNAIYSPLILATTYLWFNFAHLATQDMIFAFLVNLGIYGLIKANDKNKTNSKVNLYLLMSGSSIGLAFMMKTFFIAVPIISLSPYLFRQKEILKKNAFLFGIIIGFIPFIIWLFSINPLIDKNIILHLLNKFNNLSSSNTFTNPIYYYLWNIPLNFLPWSFISIVGLIYQFKSQANRNYYLFYFPIIFITVISLFSTKTPYYALPISSIFSINAFLGIKTLFNSNKYRDIFIVFVSRFIPFIISLSTILYFYKFKNSINLNFKEELFLISGISILALTYLLISNIRKSKYIFIALIMGPYLLSSHIVQSGLLTDRSRNIRESMEYIIEKENLYDQSIRVDVNSINNNQANSKIIRISLLTPKLGRAINKLDELSDSEYAWTTFANSLKVNNEKFEIIYSDENLKPWNLVRKKYNILKH